MSGPLVLIRHGESESSVRQQYGCHRTCLGLTELGRQQAALLSGRLAATGELDGCVAVFTSILPRAIETGDIAIAGLSDVPTVVSACALESWNGFLARAGRALARLVRALPDGTTVVFTDAGVIGATLCGLVGVEPGNLFTAPPHRTRLTAWRWTDPDDPRLLNYGDAGHLPADIRYAGTPGFA